jgi:hypothetical protein
METANTVIICAKVIALPKDVSKDVKLNIVISIENMDKNVKIKITISLKDLFFLTTISLVIGLRITKRIIKVRSVIMSKSLFLSGISAEKNIISIMNNVIVRTINIISIILE